MTDRRSSLISEIHTLIGAPEAGESAPPVSILEDALTSGYAHALALEAERLRLAEQLGDAARHGAAAGGNGGAPHLAELAERITTTERELTRLRTLLVVLRDRARAARAAALLA